MVNKQGSYKTKLPTQYKRSKKNRNVSIDGTEELRRCPTCSKRKMLIKHNYKTSNEDDKIYKYSHCQNCQYTNYVIVSYQSKTEE